MPMKINVGLARKVGEANFGSRSASLNLEVEVDGALITNPARLHDQIRHIFHLVRTALAEELRVAHGSPTAINGNGTSHPEPANGHSSRILPSEGPAPRPATPSQHRAIQAICRRLKLNVAAILKEQFRCDTLDALTLSQASQLIDRLKAKTNGNNADPE